MFKISDPAVQAATISAAATLCVARTDEGWRTMTDEARADAVLATAQMLLSRVEKMPKPAKAPKTPRKTVKLSERQSEAKHWFSSPDRQRRGGGGR
jgi:hypothetical protein